MESQTLLEKLQTLPHRGTGTENEKKAAELIAREYQRMGFSPEVQKIIIGRDGIVGHIIFYFLPFIISTVFILYSNLWLAILFYIIGLSFFWAFPFDPKKLYKKIDPASSQNVFVEVNPSKESRQTIVVFGHYDTARETKALDFIGEFLGHKLNLVSKIEKFPPFFRGPLLFTNIAVVLNLILLLIDHPLLRIVLGGLILLIYGITLYYFIHWKFSPYVPGAFDNGSGTSLVMALAYYFKQKPLLNTKLIFLNNGSEENWTTGIAEFLARGNLDKKTTFFINLDGVGGDNLLTLYGETDQLGLSTYYDRSLYSLVKEVKKEKQFTGIGDFYLPTPSDCYDVAKRGYKIVTTIISLNKNGYIDQYHKMTDTIEKINFKTMKLGQDLVIELVKKIDLR